MQIEPGFRDLSCKINQDFDLLSARIKQCIETLADCLVKRDLLRHYLLGGQKTGTDQTYDARPIVCRICPRPADIDVLECHLKPVEGIFVRV